MIARVFAWHRARAWGALNLMLAATIGLGQTAHADAQESAVGIGQIALGAQHTCAREPDGALWCSGHNASGQLGQGDIVGQTVPTRLPGINVAALPNGLGHLHSCARLADGSVSCWGENRNGQLGLGDTTRRLQPVGVQGLSSVTALALGYGHTCAVQSGDLFCWGDNDQWALGLGDRTDRLRPTRVAGLSDLTAISAGDHHTCALEAQGRLYCWGTNGYGQIGHGRVGGRSERPGPVGFSAPVVAVQAGYYHSCAITEGGALSCWGRNDNGQLGLGDRTARGFPVQVPGLTGVTAIAAGYLHTCALRSDGRVACFGRNEHGQLGLGPTDVFVTSPTLVPGLTGVTAIAADNLSTCAMTDSGALYCWGFNSSGQLGLGDTVIRRSPALVAGFGERPTATRLDAPLRTLVGQPVNLQATVTTQGGTPTGQVAFRRGGTELARSALDVQGVATASIPGLELGTYQISARYLGGAGFGPSTSPAQMVFIVHPSSAFLGGGAVFAPTEACGPGFTGAAPHPVTMRYSPSELGGLPSGVSIVWRDGAEHLALWGPMAPSGQFFGGAGRGTWTRFVFYPTRPLIRVVSRQIMVPAAGTSLIDAQEVALRVRVQNFAAIAGCSVTVVAVMRRE